MTSPSTVTTNSRAALPTEIDPAVPGGDNLMRQIDHRSRESFPHAREIAKPWGVLESVLDWCKQELQGDWRWQLVEMSTDQRLGRYIFYFDSDRDCCSFVLKWG
jgi:hypothetical protein